MPYHQNQSEPSARYMASSAFASLSGVVVFFLYRSYCASALRVLPRYSHARFSSGSPIHVVKSGVNQQPYHSDSIFRCSGNFARYSDGVTVRTVVASDSFR